MFFLFDLSVIFPYEHLMFDMWTEVKLVSEQVLCITAVIISHIAEILCWSIVQDRNCLICHFW